MLRRGTSKRTALALCSLVLVLVVWWHQGADTRSHSDQHQGADVGNHQHQGGDTRNHQHQRGDTRSHIHQVQGPSTGPVKHRERNASPVVKVGLLSRYHPLHPPFLLRILY